MDLTAGNGGYILYPLFPMATDTSPATKADIASLRVDFDALRGDVAAFRTEMLNRFDEERRFTAVMFEQLKHDVLGAIGDFVSVERDKQNNHERRIQRLERIAGVAAA